MDNPLLTGQQAMQRLEREQSGLYAGSLPTTPQRRIGEWRIAHAERVVGQQMGAIDELTRPPKYWNRSEREQKGLLVAFTTAKRCRIRFNDIVLTILFNLCVRI